MENEVPRHCFVSTNWKRIRDKIVIQQAHGTAVGLVLDPTLVKKYNAWCVNEVLYMNNALSLQQNDPVTIELNSISPPTTLLFQPSFSALCEGPSLTRKCGSAAVYCFG